ncbi:hypothetical protein CCHL11_09319 [Colletotrichum chlorophyti]|uniref:Uncharacterized protein n=1 Tax=Colletotrichum chlorophyti TaxID=708187 RepID=A0A1Q8RT79_9PEZI|nr:hypothetical protein CCHL11_09319 [Colletotrichum chlorophyti]
MRDRRFVGLILIALFTGPPFMTALINLPQRYRAINGLSPFQAGAHLLPLLFNSPLATVVAAQMATKWDVPPFYLLLFVAAMQMLSVGLASPVEPDRMKSPLGFEVVMGFGFGPTLVTVLLYVPLLVDRADLGPHTGSMIRLAVGSTILSNRLASSLLKCLTPSGVRAISSSAQSIDALFPATRSAVQSAFNKGYNDQLRTMLYLSAVTMVSMTLNWDRKLKRARDMTGY